MLTATDSATGAAVVDDVLAGEMFDDLASDVQNFISTFDAGYQPPSVPGSLSSGIPWRGMVASGCGKRGGAQSIPYRL